ncbi:ankyrin, partial [Ascobolus immersus RN42]
LHICAALNRVKVAGILLKSGADVNAANYKGTTALHYASTPEIAKLLIDAGANVNARNEDGETPLHFAQYHFTHSLEISKLLIDSGATVDNSTWMSKGLDSPLQLLARLRKTSDINIL